MTWRHVACILGAMALPVVCGFSHACASDALKEVIGLSSIVVAGVMGNAMAGVSKKDPA